MTNLTYFVGIDVSKEYVDVHVATPHQPQSLRLVNNKKGFTHLLPHLGAHSHCIMEATGPYYLPLACFLAGQGIRVSVVNPLVIKRYGQMRLLRTKTDKADARMIAAYGQQQELSLWEPPQRYQVELQQLEALCELYVSARTALSNQLHSFEATGLMEKHTGQCIARQLRELDRQVKGLEKRMLLLIKQHHQEVLESLLSIPGLGHKTAMALITLSNGFTKFTNHRQLSCYVGLCPRVVESGKSVRGKGRICKMGMSRVRALLYMCSLSAKKTNKACKDLYERLVAKGKAKKQALIAVANKLLKQAFALATRGTRYHPDHASLLYPDPIKQKNICP